MAIQITATAKRLSEQIRKEPQIILEIEGIPLIFGSQPVLEQARWDSNNIRWDSGIRWDSTVERLDSRTLISLAGTSRSIGQQMKPDKGGTSSISSFKISLVDKNGELSKEFSFEKATEMLGKRASVFLNLKGGSHPNDSLPILRGFVDDFAAADNGSIQISVTHPENLKRQSLFRQYTSTLTANIDNTQTTIPVESGEGIIVGADAMTTYVRIGDEFMEVIGTGTTSLNVIRARLGSIAVAHEFEADVASVYRLQGAPIDLALKLMMSNSDNSFFESDDDIKEFRENIQGIPNAIVFDQFNIGDSSGLVAGDLIEISGSTSNNGTYTVLFTGQFEQIGTSFIAVQERLTDEFSTSADFTYKSQFNVLPIGLGMSSNEVSVQDFLDTRDIFGTSFYDYDFYLEDTIDDMKSFIDSEIFFPQGLYAVERKARAAVKFTAPPLSINSVPTLNTSNVLNMSDVKQLRQTHKYYYNEVIYKHNKDPFSNSLKDTFASISNIAKNRIKVGNKALKIESQGTPRSQAVSLALGQTANKLINRYRFAAKQINGVQLPYKTGFTLEVGDPVVFGGLDTKLVSLQSGKREGLLESYEIINKRLDPIGGVITVDLLATGFLLVGRRAVISPSSKVAAGATTTQIPLKNLFDLGDQVPQRSKWEELSNVLLRIRSEDYSYDETARLRRLSLTNPTAIELVDPLPTAPPENAFVELAEYADMPLDDENNDAKLRYVFLSDQVEITSVTSASEFAVSSTSFLQEGILVYVHNEDYSRDSFETETKIDTIAGSTVTLDNALPFTPQVGDLVEVMGFSDNLEGGYRLV